MFLLLLTFLTRDGRSDRNTALTFDLHSDSVDVKRMIVVSFNEEYGKKVTDVLQGLKGKEVMQFRMNEPEIPVNYKWDMLAFPVMHSLGIRAEEL